MREIIDYLKLDGNNQLHISFDVDGADSSVVPGTGTQVRGGLDF